MSNITVRDLRNHGGAVLDRVSRGEILTVTKSGKPVAELRPLAQPGLTARQILERWRSLPIVDPGGLRADLDKLLDPRL